MKPHSTLKLRASTLAIAAGFALSGLPLAAQAAGLGKVTVFSALGQPLRAEVELSATREELSSMKANLASAEAFKAAGLDYATPLQTIRFAIDKRANGQSIIKLTSDKPINEPFVDMLLELNWASGRLVREYTFLLDPPEVAAKAAAQVAAPEARPLPAPPATAPAVRKAPAEAAPARPSAPPKAAEAPAERKAEGGDTYQVKSGDTLRKIASAHQHEGVSLDQMLVGIFRANKEAFDGANMNRLKSGRILTVPDKSEVESVPESDARKVVAVQASDWNAYRRKLAGMAAQAPASDDAGKQEAAGKITARVEEKVAPAAESKDQVRVSRTEAGKGKPGGKAGEDDLLAKEKALKEANDRLASLEKNVNELQKLLELKNQNLAELQKQTAKPADVRPPEMPKPAEAVKPAEPPKPVEAPKVEEKKPEVAAAPVTPAEPPKAEEAKPAPVVEEKKPEPAPQPKPKAVVPPPPPEEPSFFDELMDNPMLLAGGGGVIALLLGYVAYKRRRAGAAAEETPLGASTAGLSQSSLSENSVFRTTGGQSVDTSHTPPQTDFSQAGPGTIDTDEVDPVAEADVYMAYGRDAQAEEILLEAKNKDPKRYAIHLKLLEIYANRQSLKQFESLATELYSETGGVGADWEKAAAMGLKLDAQNPLYGGTRGAASAPEFDSDATVIVSAQSMKNTVALPGELSQMAAAAVPAAAVAAVAAAEAPALNAEPISLDFDLGPASTAAPVKESGVKSDLESTVTLPQAVSTLEEGGAGLDFDLGAGTAPAGSAAAVPDESAGALDFDMPEIKIEAEPLPAVEASALDFDLGFDTAAAPAAPAPAPAPVPAAAAAEPDLMLDAGEADAGALEFDVKLTESTVLGELPATPSFDMTSINLDLAEPKVAAEPLPSFETGQLETIVSPELANTSMAPMEPVEMAPVGASEEVATKLDLAKAYEEMGDMEGARELLQEVVQEGNAAQQEAARAILARIGS